jgi:type I restriction enzyme S subunit
VSGEITERLPAGWTRPPVYARYSVQLGKMLDEKRIVGTHLAPYLRNVDVQWSGVNTDDLPLMDFSEEDRKRYALLEGDLLVCEGGEVGRTAIWNGELDECFFQKAVHRLRATSDQDEPRYFRYFMRMAVDTGLFTVRTVSTIAHLTAEQLHVVRFPAPPRVQQRAIADYLDRETARIDALIAAKERLLGLLAEKRRALITRAVTRGLDPRAPLRDSGIPWLGEIPAHWETVALRFLVDVISGATPDTGRPEYWDGEIPWVSPKDMKRSEIADAEDHVSELALSQGSLRLIERDAVLIVVRGMILAHSFPTAITTARVTINQDMKAVRCRTSLVPRYLRDFFRGHEQHVVSLADSSAHGTRKIETEVLGRLEILVPPVPEQHAIAGYIGSATSRLDAVRDATESTIALLKERRSALIAAAVTGQIDVGSAA